MAFKTRLDPRLIQLAQPTGTNAFGIIGAGLTQFDKQQKEDEVRTLNMEEHRNKVKDDKALLDFNKHLDEGGSKRTWYENGGAFATASGATAADEMVKRRALEKMKQTRFNMSMSRARQQKKRSSVGASAVQPTFNPSAFGIPQGKQAVATSPAKTLTKTVTVYKDGKPMTITVKG